MPDYRVNLEIYNGPLDLLLYLIRRSEVEIHDIPVATITEQYLEYVDLLKELNINNASEFLVMASTLLEIKSAMILPRPAEIEQADDEDLSDPRLELVRQLLEYKKFKDAANELRAAAGDQSQRWPRSMADLRNLHDEFRQQQQQELDLEGLQLWDLFDTFNKLMQATFAGQRGHEVIQDNTPIDIYETDILDRAQREQPLTFFAVFQGRNRGEMIGLFLALLELIREKLIRVEQERTFAPIYIIPLTDEAPEIAIAHAVSADIDALPSHLNRDKKHDTTEEEST